MTPYPNLPYSHNGLRTFESVARLMSFTLAAQELNVTQSAISRQVKQLEDDLSASLLIRQHRSIELTSKGRELFSTLKSNFQSIETLISSWKEPDRKRIVIKAALSYSTRSLIPKIRALYERYPEHEIVIVPSIEEDEGIQSQDFDLLILNTRYKQRYKNTPNMHFLREEYMAPVCAQNAADVISVESILTMPRLHATLDHYDWTTWLNNQAFESIPEVRSSTFFTLDLSLSACLAGQGATVTDLLLVLPELQRGFLQCPSHVKIQHSAWSYFCYIRTESKIVEEIVEWLMEESQTEIAQLKSLAKHNHWHGVV